MKSAKETDSFLLCVQLAPFPDFSAKQNPSITASNYNWFGDMNVLTFLRDIGKHFSIKGDDQLINDDYRIYFPVLFCLSP